MRAQSIMKGWDGLLGAVDFEGEGRGEKKPEKRKREEIEEQSILFDP